MKINRKLTKVETVKFDLFIVFSIIVYVLLLPFACIFNLFKK